MFNSTVCSIRNDIHSSNQYCWKGDGVDGYILLKGAPDITTGPFTIMGWITGGSVGKAILYGRRDAISGGQYYFGVMPKLGAGNVLKFYYKNIVGTIEQYEGEAGPVTGIGNEWTHIAIVSDRSNPLVGYVNGVKETPITNLTLSSSTSLASTTGTGGNSSVAMSTDVNGSATAHIDHCVGDVCQYNKALSEAEIKECYNGGTLFDHQHGPYPDNLVYWARNNPGIRRLSATGNPDGNEVMGPMLSYTDYVTIHNMVGKDSAKKTCGRIVKGRTVV
tara:strand:- start:7223 stop:8050 length:828 start_codon:yes stop_codon:yes gene_type:complete